MPTNAYPTHVSSISSFHSLFLQVLSHPFCRAPNRHDQLQGSFLQANGHGRPQTPPPYWYQIFQNVCMQHHTVHYLLHITWMTRLSYSLSDSHAVVGFLDLMAWHILLKFSPHMHILITKFQRIILFFWCDHSWNSQNKICTRSVNRNSYLSRG
ncbi:hypothetical protein QYF36_026678 [Acer negundo]|nr:hypothetical protein QYF36_026678 [Acer negundo]